MSHLARTLASTLAAFAVVGALVGCAPSPEPTPTPTGFASEAEAFAAAEATYRAYVDALNAVDLSDPETFEPVFALTTGDLNSTDRESYSALHADAMSIDGDARVAWVERLESGNEPDEIVLAVCLDVRDVTLYDSTGTPVVNPDRPDVQELRVEAVLQHALGAYLIRDVAGLEGSRCMD